MNKRAPPGFTYSPCPGCGETHGRQKDSVCHTCAQALKSWAAMKTTIDMRRYRVPYAEHCCRIFRAPGLGEAIHALVFAVGKEDLDSVPFAESEEYNLLSALESRCDGTYLALPPRVATAIEKTWQHMHSAVKEAYRQGKQDGGRLLIQLNNGSISMDDYLDRKDR